MKSEGKIESLVRVMPTQQSLETGHTLAFQIEERLIVDLEGIFDICVSQSVFQCSSRFCASLHFRLEKSISTAPVGLCAVHCEISILEHFVGIIFRIESNSNADACSDRELVAVNRIWLP